MKTLLWVPGTTASVTYKRRDFFSEVVGTYLQALLEDDSCFVIYRITNKRKLIINN